ncbi:MAG: right-handed parallel beta-helix repeat-containing protein, partial [Actinomycetota bacterium]|nr:right-handed parallel beta-helix repeat-containing protein [Actinomycetota bacterium]
HAVLVGSESHDVIVRDNLLENGQVGGGVGGVVLFAPPGSPPIIGVIVESNRVSGFPRGGILLRNASRNLLRDNSLTSTGTPGEQRAGIMITEGSRDNVVWANHVQESRAAGIRIEVGSSGNLITNNTIADSIENDCHDDTVGQGTAGTANTWDNNRGRTENRQGLCRGGYPPLPAPA